MRISSEQVRSKFFQLPETIANVSDSLMSAFTFPNETIFDKINDLAFPFGPGCPFCDKWKVPSLHACAYGQCLPTTVVEGSCPTQEEPKVCAITTQTIIDDIEAVSKTIRLEELKR